MKDYSDTLADAFGVNRAEPVKVGSGNVVHLARTGYDCHGGETYIIVCGAGSRTSTIYSVDAEPTCTHCTA